MNCSDSGSPLIDALVGFFKFLGDPIGSIIKGIADLIMAGALAAFGALTEGIPTFAPTESKPVQGQLNWLVVYTAVGSLIFACIRMATERKGDAGTTAMKGMVRLILVAGGSTAIITAAAAVGDDFASHLYESAVKKQLETVGCGSSKDIPAFLYLILAFLLLLAAVVHGIMLYIRLAVMIVLFGTLPLAAAASMSDWGGGWWRKHIGWMIAWLLYKPAAALVIFAGTTLLTDGDREGGGGGQVDKIHLKIAGICVMLLSAVAMPALLKLIVPATAALGGGSAQSAAFSAVGGGLATGARAIAGPPDRPAGAASPGPAEHPAHPAPRAAEASPEREAGAARQDSPATARAAAREAAREAAPAEARAAAPAAAREAAPAAAEAASAAEAEAAGAAEAPAVPQQERAPPQGRPGSRRRPRSPSPRARRRPCPERWTTPTGPRATTSSANSRAARSPAVCTHGRPSAEGRPNREGSHTHVNPCRVESHVWELAAKPGGRGWAPSA